MNGGLAIALVGLTAVAALGAAQPRAQSPGDRTFTGSWSAAGTRQTLPAENGAVAAIAHLSGSIVLNGGGGFAADVIGYDDGSGATIGRAVWTDSRGDRLFSALRGGPLQTGRAVTGTFTGGTGRWTGAHGDYALTWQYVVAGEGEAIQGRAADLRGQVSTGGVVR